VANLGGGGGHWGRSLPLNKFVHEKKSYPFVSEKNRFTKADLCLKKRVYLVILCVSKLGNNKQMIRNSVKTHPILFFVVSFYKKALRKSQN